MGGKKALNADILYFLFDSANMHRWNDHLRTIELTELDKQAHKAAIAWVLGKYEETEGNRSLDWNVLIEHMLFSFIQRLVMTDLKPQVFHRIITEKSAEVNRYVLSCFDKSVPDSDEGFRRRLEEYLLSDGSSKEDDIVRAAHYLATRWEFEMIKDANKSMYGIKQTSKEIEDQIMQHKDLIGVKKLIEDKTAFNFVDLLGQLRFQQRWARTPRIPKTTVLGHSLMVADMIYLNDIDRKAGKKQIYNNFYTALFHDLPEVLTRDVISPIKLNVDGLVALLESYEKELIESKLMPLVPEAWRDELRYMVYEPFSDHDNDQEKRTGKDIKSCDLMAAYIEARVSRYYGVSSKSLSDGENELRKKLEGSGNGINAKELLSGFDRIFE